MTDTATQNTGVSNPPNNGQVSNIDVAEPNDATSSLTGAPNIPPSPQPPTPGASGAPVAGVTPGATPAPQQGQPQQPQQGQPNPLTPKQKQMGNVPAPASSTSPTVPPEVQRASRFHAVAEALTGGPQYKYTVDEYGNMQRTKVPVSTARLGLALALEALQGFTTGISQHGPGSAGRGGSMAFQQGEQRVQEQDQQARQQAQEDYARRAQVLETNMRMRTNAVQLGKMDYDANKANVDEHKPLVDLIMKQYQGYIKGIAKYSDFPKYHVTEDNAIPYEVVPRMDPETGEQVNINGKPQWDTNYLIVDPKFKASLGDALTDTDKKNFKEMGQDWADNEMVGSVPMQMSLSLNKKTQSTQWTVAKNEFQSFNDIVDDAAKKGNAVTPAKLSEPGSLTLEPVKNPEIATIVNDAANKYKEQVKDIISPDNFNALIHAIVNQESGGNPNAVSPTGATGLMQLTHGTAASLGVGDRHDPQQNADGGTRLFANLLSQYKDPKLALAAYYSGPNAVGPDGKIHDTKDHTAADTQKYVGQVSQRVGLEQAASSEDIAKIEHSSLADWTKDHKTTPADISAFMPILAATDGNYGKALDHMRTTGQSDAAANITAFLGGPTAIRTHDNALVAQAEQQKSDITTAASEKKAEDKQAMDERASAITQSYLIPPANFTFNPDIAKMSPTEASKTLAEQGVKVPNNFNALWMVGHYRAPASILPPRTWQKGAPNEMDAQTGLSYVNQFINPGYDQTKYAPAQKVRLENVSGNAKNGASIQNAGVAAQHLNILKQAGDALENGQVQALNDIALRLGAQIGATPMTTYNALVPIVAQEVGKVAAGGTVPYKEAIEADQRALQAKNTPEQRAKVIQGWTNLMYGRIHAIDENTYDTLQEHLSNVPKEASELFKSYGNDVPWYNEPTTSKVSTQGKQQQQPNPNEKPVVVNGKTIGYTLDGKTISRLAQ